VPEKKIATKAAAKPAPKSAPPAAKKATPAAVAKKAAPTAKPVKTAKTPVPSAKTAPAPKPAPEKAAKSAAPAPKPEAKAKVAVLKKADTKPAAKPQAPAKAEKAKPEAKASKPDLKAKPAKAAPEAKVDSKAKPAAKGKPAPAAKTVKPEPAPKPVKVKAEKPPKAPKPPKPPKPPKLAPVAAAFAGPIPSKPLAVAAGRAQPVTRAPIAAPVRAAPKPLTAPKPVAAEPELIGELQAVPAFKAKTGGKSGMVLVGAVAGAFGVKGEVRLRAFTEKKDGVIAYGPLYSEDGKILLKPKSWRELKDGVAVVAAEIKSKEDADKLKGTRLFVPRANLPAPPEDEFYIVDLLGCKAESVDGQVLGEICAVWNFGAGDIIEYRPPNGAPNVRITFTRETAPLVDLAGKRVVLDPPPPEPANGK